MITPKCLMKDVPGSYFLFGPRGTTFHRFSHTFSSSTIISKDISYRMLTSDNIHHIAFPKIGITLL